MKVLFQNKEDKTLRCLDVSEAGYDPGRKNLWFLGYGSDSGQAIIPNIGPLEAEKIIRDFYKEEKLDLTRHPADVSEMEFGSL